MGTTPRGIPYPEPTAFVVDGAAAMQALAEEVDTELDAVAAAAAAAVPRALVDAAGDLLVGTAADTLARLAKGATGTVLTAQAGGVGWAASAGGVVSRGTFVDTTSQLTAGTTLTKRIAIPAGCDVGILHATRNANSSNFGALVTFGKTAAEAVGTAHSGTNAYPFSSHRGNGTDVTGGAQPFNFAGFRDVYIDAATNELVVSFYSGLGSGTQPINVRGTYTVWGV